MKPSELKVVLKTLAEKKTKVTPFIWGQHGIGKSALVKQVADELGWEMIPIILSQRESVDLIGIPYVETDKETGDPVTHNYMPDWFNRVRKKGKTVLFLDEFNMARREVMAAAFELVLDRRLNNKYLPDDVLIVVAGNPNDERYDVNDLSQSLVDRFMHIQLLPDSGEWFSWAKENKLNSSLVEFFQVNPASLYKKDNRDLKFPVEITQSTRSVERASKILNLGMPTSITQECLHGILGTETTVAFMKFQAENKDVPMTVKDLLKKEDKFFKALKTWVENNKTDLVSATIENIVHHMDKNKTDIGDKLFAKFVLALPEDLSIRLLQEHGQKDDNYLQELLADSEIQALIDRRFEARKAVLEKEGNL